jgi:hypothetical protein
MSPKNSSAILARTAVICRRTWPPRCRRWCKAIRGAYETHLADGTGTRSLSRRFVDDANVTDHHAIIPTTTDPTQVSLSSDERRIYDLVCRRLLMAWHEEHIWAVTTVITNVAWRHLSPVVSPASPLQSPPHSHHRPLPHGRHRRDPAGMESARHPGTQERQRRRRAISSPGPRSKRVPSRTRCGHAGEADAATQTVQ